MTHSDDIDSYKDEMSCALEDVYWRVKVNKKSQNLLQIQMIPQLYILLCHYYWKTLEYFQKTETVI